MYRFENDHKGSNKMTINGLFSIYSVHFVWIQGGCLANMLFCFGSMQWCYNGVEM